MNRPVQIERVKTIFIVVLFMMTILLLYFLWRDTLIQGIRIPIDFLAQEQELIVPETRSILQPDKIVVNFGGDSHTLLPREQFKEWDNILLAFDNFSASNNIAISEINKNQYDEAMNVRSIRVEFDYWLPFVDALKIFGVRTAAGYETIEAFSAITYSVAIPESLLLYDGKNQKYYRLATDTDKTDLSQLISRLETEPFNPYFPVGVFLGIDNKSLMPIAMQSQMKEISYDKEINYFETDKIIKFAQSFFGEGFDFVRKITENNGTTIYMYGYGEKILNINKNGTIEYKEETDNATYKPLKYFDSLSLALQFISLHGGWDNLMSNDIAPYLKKASSFETEGKKGYVFTFGMTIKGNPVYYSGGNELLSVTILGDRIVNYKRSMPVFQENNISMLDQAPLKDTTDPINILTANYKEIKAGLNANGIVIVGITDAEIFENTSLLIDDIKTGYAIGDAKIIDQSERIYPVWIFSVGKLDFFFDIYSGEPLGSQNNLLGGQ
jgi:regulatory protein YycH of two-component signal transduction system YycFG